MTLPCLQEDPELGHTHQCNSTRSGSTGAPEPETLGLAPPTSRMIPPPRGTPAPPHEQANITSETTWIPQPSIPRSSLTHQQQYQELVPSSSRQTLNLGPQPHNYSPQNRALPTSGTALAPGLSPTLGLCIQLSHDSAQPISSQYPLHMGGFSNQSGRGQPCPQTTCSRKPVMKEGHMQLS